MKQKFFLLLMFVSILFQIVILPVNAANKWNYILNNYSDQNDRQVVQNYLDEFNHVLKYTWHSPVYKHLYLRDVIFDLNKDGSISNIQVHSFYEYPNLAPYTKDYDKHIYDYLIGINFKPFPLTIKEDKIKMGYEFKSKCSQYFLRAANVYNKGNLIFKRYNISP